MRGKFIMNVGKNNLERKEEEARKMGRKKRDEIKEGVKEKRKNFVMRKKEK